MIYCVDNLQPSGQLATHSKYRNGSTVWRLTIRIYTTTQFVCGDCDLLINGGISTVTAVKMKSLKENAKKKILRKSTNCGQIYLHYVRKAHHAIRWTRQETLLWNIEKLKAQRLIFIHFLVSELLRGNPRACNSSGAAK